MNFEKNRNGNTMTMKLDGWLDVTASPVLEGAIENMPSEITKLILDCSKLEYISSLGLRIILSAHKKMSGKDGLVLTGVNNDVKDALKMSGFLTRLNVL